MALLALATTLALLWKGNYILVCLYSLYNFSFVLRRVYHLKSNATLAYT